MIYIIKWSLTSFFSCTFLLLRQGYILNISFRWVINVEIFPLPGISFFNFIFYSFIYFNFNVNSVELIRHSFCDAMIDVETII